MAAIGGNDLITDGNGNFPWMTGYFHPETTDWFPSISKAVGLNYAPAYGVVIDGANHVTPVSQFCRTPSWDFDPIWDWVGTAVHLKDQLGTWFGLGAEDRTSDEKDLLEDDDIADEIVDVFKGMFPISPETTEGAENDRMLAYEKYTVYFWDVYLTPEYDEEGAGDGAAKAFLQAPDQTHMATADVLDTYGFRHSSPGAFVIRDSSGKNLVQFQNDGRLLMLDGSEVLTGQTITPQANEEEFIIRDSSGTVAAMIDSSSGDLYLKGTHTKVTDLRTSSNPEFVIRDAVEITQTGNADKAKFIIDTNGNLKYTGEILIRPEPQQ
jgi:hypothetical protein